MKFTSAITTSADPAAAAAEIIASLSAHVDPEAADLVVVFVAGFEPDETADVLTSVAGAFPSARSLGCGAWGTAGDDQEAYEGQSVSALAGTMPGVTLSPFAVDGAAIEGKSWLEDLPVVPDDDPKFFAVADPFTFPVDVFLGGINDHFPRAPIMGGMASLARSPGANRLLLDGAIIPDGMVGLAMTGDVAIDTVVSQGCRPVGHHAVVTRSEDNLIYELGGTPVMDFIRELAEQMAPEELALTQRGGLFLGRAIDAYKREFSRGDFLIQNVIGSDVESGAIAIGGLARRGVTVQFHVRDAVSADEDLRHLLAPYSVADASPPAAALLFTCNGRGTAMWEEPHHDAGVIRELCGPVPLAGFFCAGELGPIGGSNFIHGFTASIALIRPA